MTAAYRLKGLGWFAGCTAIVLGFYLVSLQVASERKKLEALDGRIAAAARDIRALETEFDTRANLAQLEKWNGDTLALSAPVPAQFVRGESEFASLSSRTIEPAVTTRGVGAVRMAALIVPSLPAPVAPSVPVPAAPARAPVAVAVAAAPPRAPEARTLAPQRAQLARVLLAPRVERTAAVHAVSVPARREVALLDRKLLSDTTLGDLVARARAEGARRR